jgi:hypothetical protein
VAHAGGIETAPPREMRMGTDDDDDELAAAEEDEDDDDDDDDEDDEGAGGAGEMTRGAIASLVLAGVAAGVAIAVASLPSSNDVVVGGTAPPPRSALLTTRSASVRASARCFLLWMARRLCRIPNTSAPTTTSLTNATLRRVVFCEDFAIFVVCFFFVKQEWGRRGVRGWTLMLAKTQPPRRRAAADESAGTTISWVRVEGGFDLDALKVGSGSYFWRKLYFVRSNRACFFKMAAPLSCPYHFERARGEARYRGRRWGAKKRRAVVAQVPPRGPGAPPKRGGGGAAAGHPHQERMVDQRRRNLRRNRKRARLGELEGLGELPRARP